MGEAPAIGVSEDPGLELDHLFLDRRFNAFQAEAQAKRLVTFSADGAALTLAGAGGVWATPTTGAFGGLAAADTVPAVSVFAVADAATAWLRQEPDARRGVVRLAPECFADPNRAGLENALFRAGWKLSQVELNYHLPVTNGPAFAARLGETKQKELRRLARSGAVVRAVGLDEAQPVYDTIAENRRARGYPMTMAWPALRALAAAFPDRVGFHAVERGGDILAGAVRLRITADYAYVFYWGENPAFRKESPVTFLAQGLVAAAHDEGIAVLDIGVSTEDSIPNPGLISYKEMLGCRTTAKRTYTLTLAPERHDVVR